MLARRAASRTIAVTHIRVIGSPLSSRGNTGCSSAASFGRIASSARQLLRLLDQHGSKPLRRAILAALERNTPRASSVAFLLRTQPAPPRLAVDLSHNPVAQSVDVRPHDLETYDELAHNRKRARD